MKEIVDNIDSWTLIKLIGGLSIIISSIISFGAYFIKDYFINKWKTNYQLELERLKAQSSQNNSLLANLTNSISNIYLASNEKRIEYLEKVWTGMMNLKQNIPDVISMGYTIMTKEELSNLPRSDNKYTQASIKSFNPQEYFVFQHNITKEIQNTRPFIGKQTWLIYYTYQAFIGRLVYLIEDGLEKGQVKHWQDDVNFINQILLVVIKQKELERLMENENSAFYNILNFLEYKMLNDISEQISGKRMTEETVEQALKLSKMTKNTVA